MPLADYPEEGIGCPSGQTVESRQPPVVCFGFQANSAILPGWHSPWVSTATRSRTLPRHTLLQAPVWAGYNCKGLLGHHMTSLAHSAPLFIRVSEMVPWGNYHLFPFMATQM